MPVEHSLPGGHPGRHDDGHAKDVLYALVYDPLTRAWFGALEKARPEIEDLLAGTTDDLVGSFGRFNDLFHRLVDDALRDVDGREAIIQVVRQHRDAVLWFGHMVPDNNATSDNLAESLAAKLKRNISLGVVEALICLESGYVFGQQILGCYGDGLARVLRRSRQLYGSLATLHDEQERVRLTYLTGREGYLAYPDVDYAKVLKHEVIIGSDRLLSSGAGDELRLRFRTPPVDRELILDSPVKRCPAHRLASEQDSRQSLNDVLWDLLIEIYRAAGRFA